MSDAASGGIGLTNKTSNKKGGSNKGHNKNSNGHCPDRRNDWYSTENLKGKVEGMCNLGVI